MSYLSLLTPKYKIGNIDSEPREQKMDYASFLPLLSCVWACIHLLKLLPIRRKPLTAVGLPPGPRPLPVIGNILSLGDKPHRSLENLSKTYGPVMSIKLGSVSTIVFSSSETAKQVLNRYDQAFSGRTVPAAATARDHHESSVAWLPASSHWRNLRKIFSTQLFSPPRLDATQDLRRNIVQELLDHVGERAGNGCAVDIGGAAFTASLNFLSNTVFSVNLGGDHDSEFSQEFKNVVGALMEELGRPNLADYFPALRLIDPQGIKRKTKIYFDKLFAIFDRIISERLKSEASSASNDVLDALLHLAKEKDNGWIYSDLKHLFLDLFVAGTDTTASTIEWAMAELLRKPEAMAKAQKEIREVIGKDENFVQESDISKLPYLQSVVKETLRLHPAGPLLIPHKAETDVEICGFIIPKNSQILVNVWAIHRDPRNWWNPNEFIPERYMESEIDVKGRDFKLIPFGAGRRICPGMPLAHRMVHLVLGSLLHSYDWKFEEGTKPENMDMSEKFKLTMEKAQSLWAIPVKV